MVFDHVSVSWGRDETFSINGDVINVTISDSIIAQGLETHSCGGLIQTDGGVSILRSLYIDNQTRNPKVKGVNDFVNNVVSIPKPEPVQWSPCLVLIDNALHRCTIGVAVAVRVSTRN